MLNLLFWGSLPFVLPQALWVRKCAPRFAAASGPNSGLVKPSNLTAITATTITSSKRLLAIGDSIIEGVGVSQLQHALVGQTAESLANRLKCPVNWSALGKIGIDADGVIANLLPSLPDEQADYIIVSVGVNDTTTLTLQHRWRQSLRALFKALRQHSPNAVVAVAGIPPLKHFPLLPQPLKFLLGLRAEELDKSLSLELSRYPNFFHVPVDIDFEPENFSEDGFHPSRKGYQQFGRAMAETLTVNS